MLKTLCRLALIGILLHHSLLPTSLSHSERPKAEVAAEGVERQKEAGAKRLESQVRSYLESKNSPFVEVVPHLLTKKHWKLALAISAIESQYCTKQLYLNCWGIGGDSAYRSYNSLEEGIDDFDALLTRRQAQGRWLTVESMNCSYVVPCNPNWVRVVNKVLKDLESLK